MYSNRKWQILTMQKLQIFLHQTNNCQNPQNWDLWSRQDDGRILSLPSLSHYCCFFSVTQSYLTLCDTMHDSKPSFFVHHHLPEPAQTHIHWVRDVIQKSCPLSSPSLIFSLSQNQALFQWVSSLHQVTKVLELHFSISHSNDIQDWFPLELTALISLHSKGVSRVFSNTTVWKHRFFGTLPSLWSNSHIHTWFLEKS